MDAKTYLARFYLKALFTDTWNFFAETHSVADYDWNGELPWKCYAFNAEATAGIHDATTNALIELVGPSCDNLECSSASWLNKAECELREECKTLADEHGFNGGPSNRCLHNFVIRYNNYSTTAYENFVGRVAKYLYWDTIAHGICLLITWRGNLVNATEAARRRTWLTQKLVVIGDSLLEVDSVFAEKPPPYWIAEAKRVMENAIGNEPVPYPSPIDAVHLYKRIHDRFQLDVRHIPALQIKNLSESQVDVLVYHPGYDSMEHCYQNFTDVILSGKFSGVNYVVSLRQGPVPSWITANNATVEQYFRNSQESDQCERIDDVDLKMEKKLTAELRAIVAVKCARRFVWYELGYQYFPAAYTEAPMVQIKQASMYNSNCGMLVPFP